MSLKEKVTTSIKWVYGYQILPKIVFLVSYVVLARLLTPADFGLLAIAQIIISLVQTIRETGISRAFIQHDADDETLFSTVLWLSFGLGLGFYFVIFITSPFIANFFHNQSSIMVIRLMSIQIILSSLNTCHSSALIKKLEYRRLLKIELIPMLTPLFITIPLAYKGLGVWALVIGSLSATLIRTFFLWYFFPLKLQLKINLVIAKEILHFGLFCSLESFLGWIYIWCDKGIVGHYLDAGKLGLYTMASTVSVNIFTLMFAPLSIFYPVFCSLKNNPTKMKSVLYKSIEIISLISLPAGAILFSLASVVPYFLGHQWTGIIFPLGILFITNSLSSIVSTVIPDIFRASGKVDIMPKFQTAKLIYTLPAFIVGVKFGGLVGFCYAKLFTVIIGFILYLVIAAYVLHLNWLSIVKLLSPKFIAITTTIIFLFLITGILPPINSIFLKIINNILLCTLFYSVTLAIIDYKKFISLLKIINSIIFNRKIKEI